LVVIAAAEPVVTVKKSERFVRRLFQGAVEIIKKMSPKATASDFHGCGSFHRPPLSFFFASFFFLSRACAFCGNPGRRRPQVWSAGLESGVVGHARSGYE